MAHPITTKPCRECGIVFASSQTMYCGADCRRRANARLAAAWRLRHPDHMAEAAIRRAAGLQRKRETRGYFRTCRICRKQFNTQSTNMLLCSTACRERSRVKTLASKANATLSQVEHAHESQRGVCAICGSVPKNGKRLSIDHNHATGAFRGLLCDRCNLGIGYFKDSWELLDSAAKYLTRHGDHIMKIVSA